MAGLGKSIPRIDLNDGVSIPVLGYGLGTARYKSGGGPLDKELVKTINLATSLGYNHLDGAQAYGNEEELGEAIKASKIPRDTLFVTTKYNSSADDDIPTAFANSLKKLKLDFVDLYLIHMPFPYSSDEEIQAAWKQMEEIKASGKARSIGVSNFLPKHLDAVLKTATVKPSINQVEFHLYLQRLDLQKYAKENGIRLAAYAPQVPITKASGGPVDSYLDSLAKKYAVSSGDICLRWVLEKGVVAVTTSAKEQRLSDYLRILSFQLTPREVEELDKLGQEKHFRAFFTNKFAADDRT